MFMVGISGFLLILGAKEASLSLFFLCSLVDVLRAGRQARLSAARPSLAVHFWLFQRPSVPRYSSFVSSYIATFYEHP
jgi:hypothetical protein